MVALDLSYYNKPLLMIEKKTNHQKSGNNPILMKFFKCSFIELWILLFIRYFIEELACVQRYLIGRGIWYGIYFLYVKNRL